MARGHLGLVSEHHVFLMIERLSAEVSCRWFHARGRVAFRAEEFDGRVEVVSNRAFDFDDFNRPAG